MCHFYNQQKINITTRAYEQENQNDEKYTLWSFGSGETSLSK